MTAFRASVLFLAIMAAPQAHALTNGNDLLDQCGEVSKAEANSDIDDIDFGLCIGYIDGFSDMAMLFGAYDTQKEHSIFCIPDGVTGDQLMRIAVQYLSNNPQTLHLPAAVLVATAFKEAFPCN